MRNKQLLLSGRAVTTNAANVPADRYSFLHLSDAEPNLGTAQANDYVLVYNTHANSTGNRIWSSQLILAHANANAAFAAANAAFANANGAFASANAAFANANGAFAKSNAGYNQANSGFIQANSAFGHANAAYLSQNATGQYANSAFIKANSAFDHANAAYQSQNATGQYANSAFFHANSAYQSQNTTGEYANAAFIRANNSLDANNGGTVTGDVRITGNLIVAGETTYVNTSQVLIGDNIITLNAAINQASAPTVDAGIEIDRGNAANVYLLWNETIDKWTVTNDGTGYYGIASDAAESYANSAFVTANAAFANANGAFAKANGAYTHANSGFVHANAGFLQANAAFNTGNAAFIRANNSLDANNGGTVTGNVIIVGNLTSNTLTTTGSNGSISGANAIFTNYIFAANGTVDLFIYANNAYANANGAFAAANAAFANANGAFAKSNSAFANANGAFAAANAAYIHANSGFIQANAGFIHANSGFFQANAAFANANGAFAAANAAYIQANSGFIQANASFSHANAAFANANGAFAAANAAYIQANSGFFQANAAFANANGAFAAANAAYNHANSGFIHANSAYATANFKTETFVQDTEPLTANVDDIWIDSTSGIQYVYINSNTANQWVEFSAYGTPLNGTANVQFADQTIFPITTSRPLVLSTGGDLHLNASGNVVTFNVVPSNPSISLGSSDRPFKNVWISNASIHMQGNELPGGAQPVRITNDANNVVIESGGVKIKGGALQANSFLDISHIYALNVESSLVISNATFSSQNALVKIVGSNTGYSQPPINPGYMLHITGKQNTASRIINDSFGSDANTYPIYAGRAARGTADAPTAVKAGDYLARYTGNGYDGTNYAAFGTARMDIIATEDHTTLNKGTSIIFSTMANNTNVLSNIANFDGNTSTFYGTVQATKGYLQLPRSANSGANSVAVTIDFANDSIVRATINNNMTVNFTNYIAGKSVQLWVYNRDSGGGSTHTVTHGVAATNATNQSTTKNIPGPGLAVFQYVSWDGNLANTQVVIHQG